MAAGPKALWNSYLSAIEKRPYRTKCTTSAVMFGAAQLLSQYLKDGKIESVRKILDFLLWGGIVPISAHNWQNFLARFGPQNMFIKIPFDHVSYRATVLVAFQFYCKIMENKSIGESIEWLRLYSWPTQKVAAKLWPTMNIFNYLFVPLPLRVLYQNVVLFFWVLYLAIVESRANAAKKDSSKTQAAKPVPAAGLLKSVLALAASTCVHTTFMALPQ